MPHILIVDNPSRDGWIWAGPLRRAGFRVSIAEDNDAAWHALDGDSHALLITGEHPTGGTGQELVRKARAGSERLPCIVIREATPSTGNAAGVLQPAVTLERPVLISKLLATVRELLRGDGPTRGATVLSSGITPFPVAA